MSTQAHAAPSAVKGRLSVMMFLQYAIWGAWLPLLWSFLSNVREMSAEQIGHMFAVGAIGAIISPFVAGQIADRYFNTEKFLGISHILGGLLVWQLASIDSYSGFLIFSLLYSVIYSPTLSLTNSLAFHHLEDRDRDFGKVRIWGTVGWIAVGIPWRNGCAFRTRKNNSTKAWRTPSACPRCWALPWACFASPCLPRRLRLHKSGTRPSLQSVKPRASPCSPCSCSRSRSAAFTSSTLCIRRNSWANSKAAPTNGSIWYLVSAGQA